MTETVADKIIEDALLEYHNSRYQYLRAVHGNGQSAAESKAARQLHVGAINLYLTLQPFRTHDAISDQWSEIALWEEDGEPFQLDDLASLINREVSEEQPKSMRSGTKKQTKTDYLLPQESIRAGQVLTELSRDLGADIEKSPTEDSEI